MILGDISKGDILRYLKEIKDNKYIEIIPTGEGWEKSPFLMAIPNLKSLDIGACQPG